MNTIDSSHGWLDVHSTTLPVFADLPLSWQYGVALLFGLIIGSFLSVVVVRLPRMIEAGEQEADLSFGASDRHIDQATEAARFTLWAPASACVHCGYRLRPWDNVPLFSFLLRRGRCAHCGGRISALYPLLELAGAASAALCLHHFGATLAALAGFGLLASLIALACIDARELLLPDALTQPLIWAGLMLNLGGLFAPIEAAVIGAVAGYLSFWCADRLFFLLRRRHGIGEGDFKLLAALGAWFGWQSLPIIVVLAAGTGAVFGLCALALRKMERDTMLPLGIFLGMAGALVLFDCLPPLL